MLASKFVIARYSFQNFPFSNRALPLFRTIKSAGSTLRRYGEQALRQEVQQLLLSWSAEFANVQCVFMRSGKRDKRVRYYKRCLLHYEKLC